MVMFLEAADLAVLLSFDMRDANTCVEALDRSLAEVSPDRRLSSATD